MQQLSQPVNGVEIAWLESGSGAPCLMLHGLAGDGAGSYAPVMEYLSGRRCFAPWARGHGPSGRASSYLIEDYAADMAAFIEEVIGEPVPVIGFSLGTMIGAYLAVHQPALVTALFLEDSPLLVTRDPDRHPNETYHELFPSMAAIARGVLEHGRDGDWAREQTANIRLTGPEQEGTFGDVMPDSMIAAIAGAIISNDPAVVEPAITVPTAQLSAALPPEDLGKIRCPVHILAGNWDLGGSCPPQDLERWLEFVPHATSRSFDNVGHGIRLAPHTLPDYLSELDQFLAGLAD